MTAIQVYVVFTALLAANLLGLWIFSGTIRGKTKTTLNEEDARTILQGSKLTEVEPPEIQRALRAHANAMANIIPFLFLGQLYVMIAAPRAAIVLAVCSTFTIARYGHSFAYLRGTQPWRSIFFVIGVLATVAVLILLLVGAFA
jgi:uncharacterized membrane protein YecN with MAPEG domain